MYINYILFTLVILIMLIAIYKYYELPIKTYLLTLRPDM